MDQVTSELLVSGFRYDSLKRAFLVSWVFIIAGLAVLVLSALIASLFPRSGIAHGIVQNAGILLFLDFVLMAFAGVYRLGESPDGSREGVWAVVAAVLNKAHYFIGATAIAAFIFMVILLLQFGITALAYIPYAGPFLVSLLAGLFFLVNAAAVAAALGGMAVLPPLAAEAASFRGLIKSVLDLMRGRWLSVLFYLVLSFSVLFIAVTVLYYIVRYAMGITHSVQWKINAAYPRSLSSLNLGSYVVDVVRRITPAADPIGAYMAYGNRVFDYLNMARVTIGLSYAAVFSFIASFPLAVYFSISSVFFNRLRKPVS
jgi:hypothetical protein